MHILIAPNAFKNSLTAKEASTAIERGLQESKLDCKTECFPVADGGDGTGSLIVEKCGGRFEEIAVHDPLGREINAPLGFIDNGKTAVVEMAAASGHRLLKQNERDPLKASTFGTGELALAALDAGVEKIVVTVGGSATVDGGTGFLRALGVKFFNERNEQLKAIESFTDLHRIDLSELDPRLKECKLVLLCDVDNSLLGEKGAAPVFAPQKGASPKDVKKLEAALSRLRKLSLETLEKDMAEVKHGGAAGGIAAGLWAFLGAKLENGIEEFMRITGFETSLKQAQLVITGEGSFDDQTLSGKGPMGVALKAKKAGIPVIGLGGSIPLDPTKLNQHFDALFAIGNAPEALEDALANAAENLQRAAHQVGNLLALSGQ